MKKCGAPRSRILLLTAVAVTAALAAAVLSSPDAGVMLELRKSLHITDDSFWNVSSEPCDEWLGVICESDSRRVVHIAFANRSLTGTLPASLGNLSKLMTFDAGYNIIYGPLPDFNGSVELSTLIVDFNQLTSIPESLFHSKPDLSYVSLSYNTYLLPWKIPESLKNATNLRHFSAYYCNIYGPFPEFFTGEYFPGLAHLHLAYNNLSGRVPPDLPGSLETLWLDHQGDTHSLSGDVSFVQNLTRLTSLWVKENKISGEIPDLSGHQFLEEFVISCNNLSGSLPESLSNISSLLVVDLSNNTLTGPIPGNNTGGFPNLNKLDVSNNDLSGQVPQFGPNLTTLTLCGNKHLSDERGKPCLI